MGVRTLGLAGVVSLSALCGALLFSGPPALAARGHIFEKAFGTAGSGNGELSAPWGVAINEESGDVYVTDSSNNRVEIFTSAGAYVGQFNGSGALLGEVGAAPSGQLSDPESIAVDNNSSSPSFGDVYVADIGHGVIDKFSPVGVYIGQLTETTGGSGFERIDGIAIDPSGSLWVYQQNGDITGFNGEVANGFISSLKVSASSRSSTLASPGFAVDSHGDFYVKDYYLGAIELNSAGESLVEEFDSLIEKPESLTVPSGLTADLSSNEIYIDNADGEGTVAGFSRSGSLLETFGFGHLSKGAGIAIDSRTGTIYVADSSADAVDIFTVEPSGPPKIEDESVSDVASTSATLSARLNPHGHSAAYRFEYGPTNAYGESSPISDESVGAGFETQEPRVHLQDLSPSTIYHFRVVVHNELGTIAEEDRTFVTQPVGGELTLADAREWEMVSPARKEGAEIRGISEGWEIAGYPLQAAADGDGITYNTTGPTESEPQGNAGSTRVLSVRGSSGWSSHDINLPRQNVVPISSDHEAYKLFSTDLSHGLVESVGFDLLSPEATERTPYLRSNYTSPLSQEPCPSSCYQPLVTASNVPPGTEFGGPADDEFRASLEFVGATPDLSHVLLTGVKLTTTGQAHSLYVWADGRLQLVSVLPADEGGGATEGSASLQQAHTISNDGRRVFWGSYMRDTLAGETIQMDPGAQFQVASSDGSRAFLTQGGDLYVYDVNARAGQSLTDLTPEHPGVLSILGASEDGSYIYFSTGEAVLYAVHYDGSHWETPKLIASLSGNDQPDWAEGLHNRTSRVSPNGRYLTFMSDRSLTGYDNRDLASGKPDEEVYLYDAVTDKLVCASCNPTGARPSGVEFGSGDLVAGLSTWKPTTWLAANVPGWLGLNSTEADYQPRYLSDSGRLFFDSSDALVPQDVDGTQDVYEHEPPGVGDCTSASVTFSEGSGGCVSLVSSGESPEESAFLDASEAGGDVFFMTTAKLARQDFDTGYDIYDAHECTVEASCLASPVPAPPCSTSDSCKAAPTPQPTNLGAPSSATFSGAGNVLASPVLPKTTTRSLSRAQKLSRALKACANKRNGKKRAACERAARKRYGKTTGHGAKPPAAARRSSGQSGRGGRGR